MMVWAIIPWVGGGMMGGNQAIRIQPIPSEVIPPSLMGVRQGWGGGITWDGGDEGWMGA